MPDPEPLYMTLQAGDYVKPTEAMTRQLVGFYGELPADYMGWEAPDSVGIVLRVRRNNNRWGPPRNRNTLFEVFFCNHASVASGVAFRRASYYLYAREMERLN